jgi:hypothetical protein
MPSFLVRYRESLEGGSDLLRIGRDLGLSVEFVWHERSWKMLFQIAQRESVQLPLGFKNRLSRLTVLARDDIKLLSVGGLGGAWPLRGFSTNFRKASQIAYTSWEFSFPVLPIGRGIGLWSIFFDRLDGLLFTDGAYIFETLASGETLFSYGGELRLRIVLGYGVPVELRVGIAQGTGHSSPTVYVDVGGGF